MSETILRPTAAQRPCPFIGILISGSLMIAGGTLRAHTMSFVDVWAETGPSLNVRTIHFLHDVLRTEGISGDESETVPASEVSAAVKAFGRKLDERLQIYDETGRRLASEMLAEPEWQPGRDGVRLAAAGRLRLTWRLSYRWDPGQAALTLQQKFPAELAPGAESSSAGFDRTDATNTGLAELRLRIRKAGTGHRFSAVLSDRLPQTILLGEPESTGLPVGSPTQGEASFVLFPGRLVHEFTVPLARVQGVLWRSARGNTGVPCDRPMVATDSVRRDVAAWMSDRFRLEVDGESVPPETIVTEFFGTSVDPLTADAGATIPLMATWLRIRTTHPISRVPHAVSASWPTNPGQLDSLVLHTGTESGRESRLIRISNADGFRSVVRNGLKDQNPRPAESVESGLEYSWTPNFPATGTAPD